MNQARATDHLSIGEVLSLVQEDFPDVTISKIRFLESQGLIAPERTASGYRKFFEADIDRLRWILRQQRDHFLPLKVIKRMLDQGVDLADGDGAQTTLFGDEAGGGEPQVASAVAPRGEEQRSGSSRSAAHPAVQAARQSRSARRNESPARAAVPGADGAPEDPDAAPSAQVEELDREPAAALADGESRVVRSRRCWRRSARARRRALLIAGDVADRDATAGAVVDRDVAVRPGAVRIGAVGFRVVARRRSRRHVHVRRCTGVVEPRPAESRHPRGRRRSPPGAPAGGAPAPGPRCGIRGDACRRSVRPSSRGPGPRPRCSPSGRRGSA